MSTPYPLHPEGFGREGRAFSPRQRVVSLLLVAGLLPAIFTVSVHFIFGSVPYIHEPLHENVETLGAFTALGVALLLLQRVSQDERAVHFLWLVCALVVMALLDLVHAHLPVGVEWSWFRQLACLAGGAGFALVWAPVPAGGLRRPWQYCVGGVLVAAAVTTVTMFFSEYLPSPWVEGRFSGYVIAANIGGAAGFLSAAWYFFRRYLRRAVFEDAVFGSQALLFGSTGLLFGFTNTWAIDWWSWHGFRLMAYVVALLWAYREFAALYERLGEHARELEERVQERTSELARQRAWLSTILDSIGDAVVSCDAESRVTYTNPVAAALTGWDCSATHHVPISEFIRFTGEAPCETPGGLAGRVLRTGSPVALSDPLALVNKHGSSVPIEGCATPLIAPGGAVQGVLFIFRDVSEKRRSLDALRLKEARYRTLVDNIPQRVFMKDREHRFLSVNRNFARDLGLRPPDVVGRLDDEFFGPELVAKYHADDVRVIETGEAAEFDEEYVEGGQLRLVHTIKTPVHDESGKVTGVLGVFSDVTEIRRQHQALLESERRFRATFEQAAVGMAHVAPDGAFLRVNQRLCEIVGYAMHELVERRFQEITYPADLEADLAFVRQMKAGEIRTYSMEKRYVRKDGTIIWVNLTVGALRKPAGAIDYFIAVIEDISARKRTEEALRAAGNYNRRLLESSLDPLVTIGGDGRITDANAATELVTGLSRAQLIGTDFSDYFTEPDQARAGYRQAFAEGCVRDYPLTLRRQDGHLTPVFYNASVYRDDAGKVAGVFAAARDVTEQRRTEAIVKKYTRELTVRNGISEVFLTAEGAGLYHRVLDVVLESLDSPLGVFGYIDEAGDLVVPTVTRNVWEACQVVDKQIVFPKTAWGNATWVSAIREQRAICVNVPSTGVPHGHVPIERHISIPIVHGGAAVGLLQVANKATDYTDDDVQLLQVMSDAIAPVLVARLERDWKDHELHAALENLERAQEVAQIGSWHMDLRKNELVWTRENYRIFGVPPGTRLTYETFLERVHPEDRDRVNQAWMAGVGGAPYDIEHRLVAVHGEVKWVREKADLEFDENGAAIGGTGTTQDITAQKLAEEEIRRLNASLEQRVQERTQELAAANRELESFSYAVSHDLRAPLRGMIGFSRALMEDCGEMLHGEARVYLEQIALAGQHMGELIDGMLTLSRVTRGEMCRDHVDVTALCETIRSNLREVEPDRPVEWQIELGMNAYGDGRMIEVLLRNLLENAWKYTGRTAQAVIRVYTEREESETYICVADNGAGFDMRHVDKLFVPFQRLHRQDEFPGIGIGLATCHRIVQRHGGKINARAEVNAGATFRFALPASAKSEKEAA